MEALLLVDVQNDFMPFGSLPVAEGDAVVPIANLVSPRFELVVATQDWHPPHHASFAINHHGHAPGDVTVMGGIDQVLWPAHCVQQQPGASFHSGLDVSPIQYVVHKGIDPAIDSYSAFFDNLHLRETGLEAFLRTRSVDSIVVLGLATDYCVLFTALDGRALGFDVKVVREGVRAVDVAQGDGERALDDMRAAGCAIVSVSDLRA